MTYENRVSPLVIPQKSAVRMDCCTSEVKARETLTGPSVFIPAFCRLTR